MRRFVLGLICGIAITATSAVYASDTIQAYLFPTRYVMDGHDKNLSSEYTTLNYNGHAYVPVRWIAESMGKVVKYNNDTKTIVIDNTNLSKKIVLDKDFLSFASQGKIKGIDFGINAPERDLVEKWGEPQKIGRRQSEFYSWFDYCYFFSNSDHSVSAIRIEGDTIKYTTDEIKKAVGLPKREGINDIEEGWYLYYEAGDYGVSFYSESGTGVVRSMMIKKRE